MIKARSERNVAVQLRISLFIFWSLSFIIFIFYLAPGAGFEPASSPSQSLCPLSYPGWSS